MSTGGDTEIGESLDREPPPPPPPEEEDMRLELPQQSRKPKPASVSPPVPPASLSPRKVDSLEDLYTYYPTVGDGEFQVRVTRQAPKSYGGQLIAGWLGDYNEKLSIESLRMMFGGGRYSVCIMGPPKGRNGEPGQVKQLTADIEIQIPGNPIFGAQQNGEEYAMQGMIGGMRGVPLMEPPAVTMKRMDLDEKERERQRQIVERTHTTPEHVVRAIQDQAQSSMHEIRSLADSKMELLREQNQVLMKAVADRDTELKSLRDDLLKTRSEANDAVRRAETELEKRLSETHAKSIDALKDAHNKEFRDVESRHRERMDDAVRRYTEESNRRETDSRNERDRIIRDAERSEKMLKETFESRISDLARTTGREIDTVRELRDREIQALKSQYESAAKSSETSANFRIEMNTSEVNRLRTENESLRRENERLLKASIKDPVTFLQETRMVATDLLGMVSAEDAKGDGDDGPFDWKKEGAKLVSNLVQKLPETVKGASEAVAAVRAQNQQNMAAAQQMAAAQAQGHPPQAPGRALPAPGGGGGKRRIAPPPQGWTGAGSPPPYVGPVLGADIPFQQPYAPMPHHQQQPALQPQAAVPQPQPAPVQETGPSAPPENVNEGIELFIKELDSAYREDVPPAMFAKGFVDHIGRDQASHLLSTVSAESFLEQVERSGRDLSLLTMDGRKYVQSLWAEAKKLLAS